MEGKGLTEAEETVPGETQRDGPSGAAILSNFMFSLCIFAVYIDRYLWNKLKKIFKCLLQYILLHYNSPTLILVCP